jgi:hypothetical protein
LKREGGIHGTRQPDTVVAIEEVNSQFLKFNKQVEALEPYMWVYCQNGAMEDHLQLLPLIEMSRSGGTIVQLANVGRESHAYLQHITQHYHELAQHTLFSQDLPDPGFHFPRFEVAHTTTDISLH